MNRRFSAVASAMVAAGLVLAGVLYSLMPKEADESLRSVTFQPGDLNFIMGSGELISGSLKINGFQDGYAVLSSGPVSMNAKEYPLLFVNLELGDFNALDDRAPAFFWRKKDQTGQVSKVSLDGSKMIDLQNVRGWSEEITEIGFLFQQSGGQIEAFGEVSFKGRSLFSNLSITFEDWFQFEPWTQRSINFLNGGAAKQALPLPVLLLAWVLLALFIYFLSGNRSLRGLAAYGLLMVLIAWMLLDVRWTLNGATQMSDSIKNRWKLSDLERLQTGPDAELYGLVSQFKEKMHGQEPRRIIIVGDNTRFSYYLMRAKYHLLPDAALIRNHLSENPNLGEIDYVIFIDDFASKNARWYDIWLQLPMDEAWRNSLELVDSGSFGVLFSVNH